VTAREAIAPQLGGGWIVTGGCGRPHLTGAAWSWWRCKPCKRAQSAATLRAVESIRLSLYYPENPPAPTCGGPTFGASYARHRRAGETCGVCLEGNRYEQRVRDQRKANA
jgi:hypothetical protein